MKLRTIPLPTTPIPSPTPMKTTKRGVVWMPRKTTTKDENVALYNARVFNYLNRNRSILNTQGGIR